MTFYIYTGATPDTLASGRPVAFGDALALSDSVSDANARLIRAGLLVPVSKPKKEGAK